jgi:hypothetical protein
VLDTGDRDLGCYVTARLTPQLGLLGKPTFTPANITFVGLGSNSNLGQTACHSNKENFLTVIGKTSYYRLTDHFKDGAAVVRIKIEVARAAVQ